ncbi:LysR substrate-binding domain-containing protein [Massilia sp. TS11]|uniref:LysR substrate-binding domain-containing protein n=1 Tax=Massilia sp. TS11 TaxID=2908003 RepID=UPI001EDB829A|nr:LysR substrate-binding domain-containing protein [Massilia sp. TS11]MCG2583264.1 LysR substrate-binding domain-containing protein [Massilia sp. TS11]
MLKLSLDALQVLDAIARRGSFSGAGAELHRVPSTISYTVAKLEQDLDVQLFTRHGPQVRLTAAGRELLAEGRQLLLAAEELEYRVRRVAQGWETEFALGLDGSVDPALLETDLADFYALNCGTRLRIASENLTGTWEALLERRVDLLIGAAGEGPPGGGYVAEELGSLRFVFCVAPQHPLASAPEPLTGAVLAAHRAVVVADSARRLAPRTVGLLLGQDSLTVPDMRAKLAAQCAGLGFGFLPEPTARAAIARGQLVARHVEQGRADERFFLAWRSGDDGQALRWWRARWRGPDAFARLLAHLPGV